MSANASNPISAGELADHRGVRDCLASFTRQKQWISEIQLEVCRIPARTFLEGERAVWIRDQFRAYGWDAALDRVGNVVAVDGEGPYVALAAHIDTVLAPRTRADISIEGGCFHGPGVTDNGAGIAALLAIARLWKSSSDLLPERHRGLLLAANVGEEGEGNLLGMRHLCVDSEWADRIAAVLVIDGANTDHVTTRGLGSRRFEITFSGPGGHSWSDFGTANPVHALCRAVSLFSDTKIASTPRSAINVGLIDGGSSVNAIAQTATAKVDLRSESNEKLEELAATLLACVYRARDLENQRSTGSRVLAKHREIGARPAAALASDAPLLRYLRTVDSHLGIRAQLDCSSTDANIPLSLGIPALALGGGGTGGGAHSSQEWYRPDGRDLGLKRIFLILLLLLREGGPAPW
jgi:tripeptide aminopeptidase